MAKYVYPAVFTKEKEGGYSVAFPDVPGCYTQGETLSEAIEMAEDALGLMLCTCEDKELIINSPSEINSLHLADNEIATLILCDTLEVRKGIDNKAVKKTLTIPSWLNTMSMRENLNFSSILQEALMEKLGLNS